MVNHADKQMNDAGEGEFIAGKQNRVPGTMSYWLSMVTDRVYLGFVFLLNDSYPLLGLYN